MGDETRNGFEYEGLFYPWHITSTGKDLLLIDRISGMAPQAFFDLIEDDYDMSRAPVTLTLVATSIRNRFPDRSLERIVRTVMDLSIVDDITIVGGDDVGDADPPTVETGGSSELSPPEPNVSSGVTSETLPEILA